MFCVPASIISDVSSSKSFAMASGWMSLSLWHAMCVFVRSLLEMLREALIVQWSDIKGQAQHLSIWI